jgi:hypothetical protein
MSAFLIRLIVELVCYAVTMLALWAAGNEQLTQTLRRLLIVLGVLAAIVGGLACLALSPQPPFSTYSAFLLAGCNILTYFALVCTQIRRVGAESAIAAFAFGATTGSILRVLAEWAIWLGWGTTPTTLTGVILGLVVPFGAIVFVTTRTLLPMPTGAYIAHQWTLRRRQLFLNFQVSFSLLVIGMFLIAIGLESGALQNIRMVRSLLLLLHYLPWVGIALAIRLGLKPIETDALPTPRRQPQHYGPDK